MKKHHSFLPLNTIRMRHLTIIALAFTFILTTCQSGTNPTNFSTGEAPDLVKKVDFQPFAKHVRRLARKLEYLGAPLPQSITEQLKTLAFDSANADIVAIQKLIGSSLSG